ncbi:hypothetical protein Lepto7375DRAFT_1596 [Leptolyngbya sp. PCC 7375]|nr:hypothetical protein Lepto7375DRAFT_1596 [Leptolyngbya sp. PCC 7375]
MAIFPIVTFFLLFIVITKQLLDKASDMPDRALNEVNLSIGDKTPIVLEIDSLHSLVRLIAQLDSEKQ